METEITLTCSFCGHTTDTIEKMVAGVDGAICENCLNQALEIIERGVSNVTADMALKVPTPMEIKLTLDEYVIGQHEAKEYLSVAVYNHYMRLNQQMLDEVELQKSNVILVGPTGCGKSLLAQTIAKILDVPFATADATSLTEAGYVGSDIDTVITNLIQDAKGDIAQAERGIVYIDEIDKIAHRAGSVRDVSGEGVQQALLSMLDGSIISVTDPSGHTSNEKPKIQVDTSNILFICSGAFSGIEDIIRRRVGKTRQGIGFGSKGDRIKKVEHVLQYLKASDLVSYGMIPEFVGRIPIITVIHQLYAKDLIRILVEPRNALIKQYTKLMGAIGVKLAFSQEALERISELSLNRGTGARGLKSVVEQAMIKIMFDSPSNRAIKMCFIGKGVIDGGEEPLIVYGSD